MKARGWLTLFALGVALSAWQWHELNEAPEVHAGHTHLHDDSGKPARLYGWQAEEAYRVQLSRGDGKLVFTRESGAWTSNGANFDPADFVALFSQVRGERQIDPEPGQPYGLEPPALHIEVSGPEEKMLARLDVGDLAPDGLSRYIRLAGESKLRMIPDYHVRAALAATGSDTSEK